MSERPTNERRTAPRARFDTAVIVHMDGQKTTWQGHDVSETGLGITPAAWVRAEREGQLVRVRFALPQAGLCGTRRIRWIEAQASIVRRERRRLGLRLLEVKDADRRAIRTYVFTGSAEIREYDPA